MKQHSSGFIIGIAASIILGFGVVAGIFLGLRSIGGPWLRTHCVASGQNGPEQCNTQHLYVPRQPGLPPRRAQPGNWVGNLLPKHQLGTAPEQPYHCCHQAIR